MKTDRMMTILLTLLKEKRIGAKELSQTLEVSVRTIYRDIDRLCMAGVPIRAVSGVHGGFEILPDFKLDRNVFSPEDLRDIVSGLSGLSQLMPNNPTIHAFTKVLSLAPELYRTEIEHSADQIRIETDPWFGNHDIAKAFEIFRAAIRASRPVSFDYTDHNGTCSHRTVEPIQLISKAGNWYVRAYCRLRETHRLFRLSRVRNAVLSSDRFPPRDIPPLNTDLEKDNACAVQTITLQIDRSVMDRVLDICPFDRFTPDGLGGYFVEFPFVENEFSYDLILSYGPACKCIRPAHIRKALKDRLEIMLAAYTDAPS